MMYLVLPKTYRQIEGQSEIQLLIFSIFCYEHHIRRASRYY